VQPAASSFAAVSAQAPDDDASRAPATAARQEAGDRLRDSATIALAAAGHSLIASFAIAAAGMAGCEVYAGGSSFIGWLALAGAIAIASSVVVTRATHDLRKGGSTQVAWRRLIGAVMAMLTTMALAPWWLAAGASLEDSGAFALVLTAFELVAVAMLAPSGAAATTACLVPLSVVAADLLDGDARHPPAAALACLVAVVMGVLLALALHRRWTSAAREANELKDRANAIESARKAAVQADFEKSRFLAIASHDLRQPVHAIGLFAATLEKRLQGSAEEPLVRNLTRAIDGLDRSFNVMLDISRLDAGAVEPRIRHFPLRDLFRRLHMHFAGHAEQKGLGLRFSPGGKSISSDPQLLERVLGNLIQNAIKYTEVGGIVVVARSTPTHINVEVWDTGIGIRAADLRKVFDEFYQVGRNRRVRSQGLGMGLAIVKRLVQLMGHELIVSSSPGRGTMFRLRIALGGLPEVQDVTAAADTLPMPILQARTVLVLDDEEPIRDGLCMLLQEWGFEAIGAGSIDDALRAIALLEIPPDLILSDLQLGEGPDGIAGIEAIRRQCGAEVAAMLITGDTSHDEIRRATESGHPVLFKPVQPRKLYDALRGLSA
jgi:signal transduction histidine kinase/CheY-like chemotaxis protein